MDLTDSVENEWLCHMILKVYGIPVADAEIAFFDDVKVLVVKRFDRRWADDHSWLIRLPQEDMCQALNVARSIFDGMKNARDRLLRKQYLSKFNQFTKRLLLSNADNNPYLNIVCLITMDILGC
jgi:hypothetical protein